MARISNLNSFQGSNIDDYFVPIDSSNDATYRYPGSRIKNAYVNATSWITKVNLQPYTILFHKDMTSLAPATSTYTWTQIKTQNTAAFYPFGGIYYYDGQSAISAQGTIPSNTLKSEGIVDLRNSFNIPSQWSANNPVYVRCEASGSTDGKVKFNIQTEWGAGGTKEVVLVNALPSEDDSYYYIHLGQTIDNAGNMYLTPWHPVYVRRNGSVRIYGQYANYASSAGAATNDGGGNNIASTYMSFKGQFTGSIDATNIDPGVYYLDAYSITIDGTATGYYGTFIQFPGTYKAQAIFASPAASTSSYGGMLTRRYYTSTTSWSNWMSDIWHKGNMPIAQLSPTAATISGVTFNRSYFYRMGPIVYCQANITLSSGTTVATNTNLFTGLPAAVGTTDMPLSSSSAYNKSVYVNSSGQLKTSGSITAGTWVFNGWYYTTA